MNLAVFAKAVAILLLVICKQGSTEEQTHQDEPESREKRGLNMLRLGRGLQMLRLGKRGLNMLRLGRSDYNALDRDSYMIDPESLNGEDDYLYSESGRFRRSVDGERAVALPRIGKQLKEGEYGEDMDEYLMRALEDEEEFKNEKRALGMLRLGKRPMNMLRLGKRPMNMLRLGKRPMNMLRLGKRPMNMLRLGKRPMNMLRLGKRDDETDATDEKRALGMLRLGKRSSETVNEDASVDAQQ